MGRIKGGHDSEPRKRRVRFPAYYKDGVYYKKCSKCLIDKIATDFDKGGKVYGSILYSHCQDCRRIKNRKSYRKNPKKVQQQMRAARLKREYGLSLEDYDAMLTKQNGKCAICFESFLVTGRKPHVDHCHRTNQVRGLLCHMCNHLLGSAKDMPLILASASKYLERFLCPIET